MRVLYAKGFKNRAVRLMSEPHENYSSQTKALQSVAKKLNTDMEVPVQTKRVMRMVGCMSPPSISSATRSSDDPSKLATLRACLA